jgi:hypothetical protein
MFDEQHNEGRPDQIPANDKKCTHELKPDLLSVSSDGTAPRFY